MSMRLERLNGKENGETGNRVRKTSMPHYKSWAELSSNSGKVSMGKLCKISLEK